MPTTLLGANQHFVQWTVANLNKLQWWTQGHFLTDLVCWCGSLINNNPHALIHTLKHYVINSELSCQQHITVNTSGYLPFLTVTDLHLSGEPLVVVHCVCLLDSGSHGCTQKQNLQTCYHGYVLTFFLSAVWSYNGIHNECSKMFFSPILWQSCSEHPAVLCFAWPNLLTLSSSQYLAPLVNHRGAKAKSIMGRLGALYNWTNVSEETGSQFIMWHCVSHVRID